MAREKTIFDLLIRPTAFRLGKPYANHPRKRAIFYQGRRCGFVITQSYDGLRDIIINEHTLWAESPSTPDDQLREMLAEDLLMMRNAIRHHKVIKRLDMPVYHALFSLNRPRW